MTGRRRVTRALVAAALLIGPIAGLSACTAGSAPEPSWTPFVPVLVDGAEVVAVCPGDLPELPGGAAAASGSPDLGEVDAAWLCEYPVDRDGFDAPPAAAIEDLDAVRALVEAFAPADVDRPCTADYGPTLLLMLDRGGLRTEVVMTDYGCRFAAVAGSDGLLSGPAGTTGELRALAGV
ncbi:hypothetical protein [Demequina lignilytica]|uniref:DUF3558 domain-containing protein n=1 Tax=Demequina lignilytica TaxID=3051663 RepID=A0AB35MJH1_9MICO|nr:hypothetical protein [Demequina sp. SYSU T0a273]MDN4483936.1 hypothetical protein [Demequina sp. SYSU T0a273]